MKKTIFTLLSCLIMAVAAHAQVSDTVQMRVWYQYHQENDTVNHQGFDEQMRLDIGKQMSVYYSENDALSDSIMKVQELAGMGWQEIIDKRGSLPKYKVYEKVFKNYPRAGTLTFFNTILLDKYQYYENIPAYNGI